MDTTLGHNGHPRSIPWRWIAWGTAALLMLAAALAKLTLGDAFQWTGSDFVAAAILLGVPCALFEVALRMARGNTSYIVASCLGLGTGFLTVWINLAVGIIGDEDNAANLAFAAVLAIALVGAALARLRPAGLSRAMVVTGVAQLLVAPYAWSLGSPEGVATSLVFAAAWFGAAALFRAAARTPGARPPAARP
jgi:hypothetical protein